MTSTHKHTQTHKAYHLVLNFALNLTIGGLKPEVRRAYLTTRGFVRETFSSMKTLMESDQHMQGQSNLAQEDKSEINEEEVESIVGLDQKKRGTSNWQASGS